MREPGSQRHLGPEADDGAAEMSGIDPQLLRPTDAGKLGQEARNLIANRALEVVNAALDAASRGNYQLLKYLFEEAGIFSVRTDGDEHKDSFSARMREVFHSQHQAHRGKCALIKPVVGDAVE